MLSTILQNFTVTEARIPDLRMTSVKDFELKLLEEVREVLIESDWDKKALELGDVATVCFNFMMAYGYDPEQVIKNVLIKNQSKLNRAESDVD